MTSPEWDLVVLVADADMEAGVQSLLRRNQPSYSGFTFKIFPHPNKDPGCRIEAHNFLRPFSNKASHAMVLFDYHGSGMEKFSRQEVEQEVEKRLECSGWKGRCAVIAISPELENWVWSNSPEVDRILGWQGRSPGLREWLKDKGLWGDTDKPADPKEAYRRCLREAKKAWSPSLFAALASSVSFNRCKDPSFLKLKNTLAEWFAPPEP